jgi:hypothetical protein
MSKKQAKSERDVDLPDWADDVTPTDEVMKKFYAPTGTFKSGPIAVQPGAAPATESSAASPKEENRDKSVASQVEPLEVIDSSPEEAVTTPLTPTNVIEKEDKGEKTSPTPSALKDRAPLEEKVKAGDVEASDIAETPVRKTLTETPGGSQTSSFEEFARKWKRYLYPGQLAVMRTLFELTIESGTSECFTRYSAIAAETKMTRRNCINVMNSLVDRGFVTRLEVRNDATSKGIRLRIHTDPLL